MGFEEFLDRELGGLARFAGVLVGNPDDAHDVLSDALEAAFTRWDRVAQADHPAAYVRGIITHQFLNLRRTGARRKTSTVASLEYLGSPAMIRSADGADTAAVEHRDHLHRLIQGLPPKQLAAVVLRYYLDLDDTEAAAVLGVSESTFRSNVARALRRLRATTSHDRLESR